MNASTFLVIASRHLGLDGDDVRGIRYGRRLYDVPILAEDKVRFIGERVAAVAAVDRDAAEEALLLIDVEYEELPAVFEPLEALAPDAPILHPDVNSYVGLPAQLESPTNAFVSETWGRGDIEFGFKQADLIVENTFTVSRQHQAYLETHTCLVWIDGQGRVQIWASCKVPYAIKQQLSAALGLPEERIRLNPVSIGGDFGGKGSPMNIPLTYFLAVRTGRPVKMVMEWVDEFIAGNPRHAALIQMKTGVKQDGTLVAHQARVLFNSGAYGGFKPAPGVNLGGASKSGGPYKIPHMHIEGVQVYTNTVPGGFMRAPGEPQAVFAAESQMDLVARRLGMDPLEFRRKNLIEEGDENPIGTVYTNVKAIETLEAVVSASGYENPKATNVGRGIAMGERPVAGGESHASVTLSQDGAVTVHTSIFEPGTGTYTLLRQIVSEELGVLAEDIQVEVWDTDGVPFDTGVGGSRVTRVAGLAAYQAATEASKEMLSVAADLLGWPEEQTSIRGANVVRQDTSESRPWAELLAQLGRPVVARGHVLDPDRSPTSSFTAQVAEMSVDPETGQVTLLRFTTAHDVGKVINPGGPPGSDRRRGYPGHRLRPHRGPKRGGRPGHRPQLRRIQDPQHPGHSPVADGALGIGHRAGALQLPGNRRKPLRARGPGYRQRGSGCRRRQNQGPAHLRREGWAGAGSLIGVTLTIGWVQQLRTFVSEKSNAWAD